MSAAETKVAAATVTAAAPAAGMSAVNEHAYETTATDYKRAKQLPGRTHCEWFTFFEVLCGRGTTVVTPTIDAAPATPPSAAAAAAAALPSPAPLPLAGQTALDLACGEGFATRRLISLCGASRVVGVDLSSAMIALAQAEQKRAPLPGLSYAVADARTLALGEAFDVVAAFYLLNYARDEADLSAFVRTIAAHLKPGGRLIAMNNNPSADPDSYSDCGLRHGIRRSTKDPHNMKDGDAIRYEIFVPPPETTTPASLPAPSVVFENYFLSLDTHRRVFLANGFDSFAAHPQRVDPSVVRTAAELEFWRPCWEHPYTIAFEAVRSKASAK